MCYQRSVRSQSGRETESPSLEVEQSSAVDEVSRKMRFSHIKNKIHVPSVHYSQHILTALACRYLSFGFRIDSLRYFIDQMIDRLNNLCEINS